MPLDNNQEKNDLRRNNMFFDNNIKKLFNDNNEKILIHNISASNYTLSGIKRYGPLHIKDKALINEMYNNYRLVFCNHYVQFSHIVYDYTNRYKDKILTREERSKYLAQTRDFYDKLQIYIKQFYPDFSFLKNATKLGHDGLEQLFCQCYKTFDNVDRIFELCEDINYLKDNTKVLNTIIKFYSIIEEFVIRYYNFSIVGVSDQKYIITSCNNCDKKFIDYLLQGYSLIRLRKLYLVDESHYEYVPSLPTKDIGYKIDEYIETDDNNEINSKKFVKVL